MNYDQFTKLDAEQQQQLAQGRLIAEFNQRLLVTGQPTEAQREMVHKTLSTEPAHALLVFHSPVKEQDLIVCFRDWKDAGIFIAREPVSEVEIIAVSAWK